MNKTKSKRPTKKTVKNTTKSDAKRMNFIERYKRHIELEHHFTPHCATQAQAMLARGDFVSEVAEYFRVKVATIEALERLDMSDPKVRRMFVIPKAPKRLSPRAVETMHSSLRDLQTELDTLKKILEEATEA